MAILKIIQNGAEESRTFEGPALLSDLLADFGYAVPHPCAGRGICKKCSVLLNGTPVLACRTRLTEDAAVELPDAEEIQSVTGGSDSGKITESVCLCLDIGTTTLALSLVSLDDKTVIRTKTAPNPQRVFGADVISRIDRCMKKGPKEQQILLCEQIREMISDLLSEFELPQISTLYVAGNTTMLHLFFGVDCSSLGTAPYTPVFLDRRTVSGESLGLPAVRRVQSLPGIAAFVGADIVAGIHYVGLPSEGKYRILLDLGTNAEIALFNSEKILCTAAAAGPCFEGANISCGMPASPGAVCAVESDGSVSVIGKGEPKGLCATGLIDAIAEGVRREAIDETGFLEEEVLEVCPNVSLTASDIREFQLAKSAIRAATECLLKRENISFDAVEGFYVAGGFSAGLKVKNAVFVGLFPEELEEKFHGINNASLLGTVRFACTQKISAPLAKAEYVDLSADPLFSNLFMEYMMF